MKKKKLDLNIIVPLLLFFILSLLSINSASVYTSKSLGNLVLKQSLWYLVGSVLVIIILKFKNNIFYKNHVFLYVTGCLLLLSLLFFGTSVNNSKCWFIIPGIGSFQPSEFMKISLMISLSVMIKDYKITYKNPTVKEEFMFILKTFLVVLIPSILTFLEPDTGAVLMYFIIYFIMIELAGIRKRWNISFLVLAIVSILIVLYLYFFKTNTFINIFGTKMFYRFDRIFDWQKGSGMQLENALSAIGSSGIIGHGFKKTPIYFPEASTDFIFAVYASNFGFLGSIFLVGLILYFDIYIINLMSKKIDLKDKYILAGISSCLIFQHIENIGMTIGLLPITGITLPFISYGGSSLLSYMIMIGIVLNIASTKEKKYQTIE